MRNRQRIVAVILVFIMVLLLCSCGKPFDIEGYWVSEDDGSSNDQIHLELLKGGKGSIEGYSCSWYTDDHTLVLDSGYAKIEFGFYVLGMKLVLNYDDTTYVFHREAKE